MQTITITESDIATAVAGGAGTGQGLTVEKLEVRFLDDKMQISANLLRFGPVEVRDLVLVGRLEAQNGKLHLETESVSPRGLVAAMIPPLADRALAQYASQWTVQEVRTLEGRLELTVQ